jgi:hypothetical protein
MKIGTSGSYIYKKLYTTRSLCSLENTEKTLCLRISL